LRQLHARFCSRPVAAWSAPAFPAEFGRLCTGIRVMGSSRPRLRTPPTRRSSEPPSLESDWPRPRQCWTGRRGRKSTAKATPLKLMSRPDWDENRKQQVASPRHPESIAGWTSDTLKGLDRTNRTGAGSVPHAEHRPANRLGWAPSLARSRIHAAKIEEGPRIDGGLRPLVASARVGLTSMACWRGRRSVAPATRCSQSASSGRMRWCPLDGAE
jgi:hypothetical protein